MESLSRILAIVLLVVFAAGTVAHAANATSMSLAMSPVAMDDGDMGDCDACPPDNSGKTPACGQACLAPFVAIPAPVSVELSFVAAEIATSPLEELVGHTGPPDLSPPRIIIL
ncbi:hypothetical protein EJ066_29915 [Mesorhizobium sp. M9A.F.Ca.ET.002.03.1.2]|uniref:hypothetical protein n=1 Tax=Mesorhizobium sp. M9A.F.Ca.ET.002.03.1.2 TaxID=2493668 RepID=UPI000F7548E1|nr:hypothetical protein [Mesorhizobium sp. M9A.F.Ca.ET.002.03.1.2]AZO00970.1 hypothetical protein EJ066_29915 [Mesorhizobium sp. M9A.F.Ca.ET.002.03.1.2]